MEQAEAISFSAEITAETEGAEFVCSADCRSSADTVELTVLAPALIAGVTARVTPEGAALQYGGAQLALGPLTGSALTPMTALPVLIDALRTGHVERVWREHTPEGERFVVSLLRGEDETITVCFDDAGAPTDAALAVAGRTVLHCALSDWRTQ